MTAGPSGATGPPDDAEQLKEQIEATRDRLGETVERLAAKADVKAQAQATVTNLTQRAKDRTSQVRQQAAAAGGSGRARVSAAAAPLWDAAPDPVKQAVSTGTEGARQYRRQLAIAAGVLVAGVVVLRWWNRR